MKLDNYVCSLPLVGSFLQRWYTFFRKNTLIANVIHLSGGLALGLFMGGVVNFATLIFAVIYFGGHAYGLLKPS